MAFSIVCHTAQGLASGGGTTSGIDTSTVTYMQVWVSSYSGTNVIGSGALHDNKSNTFNFVGFANDGLNISRLCIWDCLNPTVGSGHTFTLDNAGGAIGGSFPSIAIVGTKGNAASSVIDQGSGTSSTASGTSVQPGSITPSTNNQLVIAGASVLGAWSSGGVSGMTLLDSLPGDGVNYQGIIIGYTIQSSATPINPTFSWTTSENNSAAIESMKDDGIAGGGGGPSALEWLPSYRAERRGGVRVMASGFTPPDHKV